MARRRRAQISSGRISENSWLRVGDACQVLGISRSTLLAAEEAGLITAARTPGGHRRFATDELDRFLRAHGRARAQDRLQAPEPDVQPQPAQLVADVRTALRELVQLIDGTCAGIYLLHDGRLAYCSGFGIPRWQADQLRASPPPEPVVAALGASRPRLVDADALVSRPRGGQAVAQALLSEDRVLGAMFVVTRVGQELLPGELRIIAAAQRMVGLLVDRLQRLADMERRLTHVRELAVLRAG